MTKDDGAIRGLGGTMDMKDALSWNIIKFPKRIVSVRSRPPCLFLADGIEGT